MTSPIRMNTLTALLVLSLGSATALAQTAVPAKSSAAAAATEAAAPQSRKDAVSYAIGVSTARNLAKDGVEFDPDWVLKGMRDQMSGQRMLLNEREVRQAMSGLIGEMRQKLAANRVEMEAANKKKGEEYRANFEKQPGVQKLPNGVLYQVVKAGNGPRPTEDSNIMVNYRGTLIGGYEFDATPEGKPAMLKMGQLIVGWREALKVMPVGSRWTLVIPPALAYGVRGVGSDIGPSETLVFDVELVSIAK